MTFDLWLASRQISYRNLVLRRALVLALLLFGIAHPSSAQQPTTWWPDALAGVMWSGSDIKTKHPPNYAAAQNLCAVSKIGGFTGWRLPTLAEAEAATDAANAYPVLDRANHIGQPPGLKELDYHSPVASSKFKFLSASYSSIWTSTPDGNGRVYLKDWTPPGASHSIAVTDSGRDTWSLAVFCVRPMEPDLLQLAKDAHPATPVSGLPQLKSIALLAQAEDALAKDNFSGAITEAKQALALDPKSVRALDDLGIANAYVGNWADALSNLQTARSLDKLLSKTSDDIRCVKAVQKQAAADPKALQAWVLIHDADIAQAKERYEDAVAAANQLIALQPSWAEGYDRLGLALEGLDQWPDAIAALTKAVSLKKHGATNAKQDLENAKSSWKK